MRIFLTCRPPEGEYEGHLQLAVAPNGLTPPGQLVSAPYTPENATLVIEKVRDILMHGFDFETMTTLQPNTTAASPPEEQEVERLVPRRLGALNSESGEITGLPNHPQGGIHPAIVGVDPAAGPAAAPDGGHNDHAD